MNNITFGQYVPGKSWIYKLDPRTKILLTIALIVLIFLIPDLIWMASALLVFVVILISTRIPILKIIKSIKGVIFLLLFTVLLLVISLVRVNAASISVSAGKNVTVGSSFKVNVKVSGAAGWEYCLSYDERYFSYVSSNSDTGGLCVKTGSTLTGYADVTYNFKAIAAGTGAFTINSGNAYDDDGNVLETSKGSVNVVVVAQKELNPAENQTNNYSDNANLKSLEVVGYSLTPEFDKNTTTYSLEVENEVTKVAINAYRDDVTSSISSSASDTDNIELTEGLNKITFTVTAQKGNRKVYTINTTTKYFGRK